MRAFFLSMAVLTLGCKGDKDDSGTNPGPDPLKFTTYNAGLAVAFVPSANERAPVVADAIAALDSDVICLQEVWLPEHVALVEAAAQGKFDYTYFPAPQQEQFAAPACAPGAFDSMQNCMDAQCAGSCDDELVGCILASCPLDFLTLPPDCGRCVMAHVGSTSDGQVVADACNNGGIEYAYGGSFGTGILSKYPLSGIEEVVLDSTTNRRGLLHAKVDAPIGEIDLWCTHLTAGLSSIPYPRTTGNWESEQLAQAELLAGLLTDAPDPVVAMGDLNNGPTTAFAQEEFAANYQTLLAAGVTSPYVELDGRCSFCPDNKLSSADTDEDARLIDHILIRGIAGDIEAGRELDGPLQTETCGVSVEGNYSDHYGVSVSIFE